MTHQQRKSNHRTALVLVALGTVACHGSGSNQDSSAPLAEASPARDGHAEGEQDRDQVREWNQIFIEMLGATKAPNPASPRLGAIVHTAIFDACNGIEQVYAPIHVKDPAPVGASAPAAVVSAAYTALVGLFPSEEPALRARYAASIAALADESVQSRERGIAWGRQVALAVLAWRKADGFEAERPAFRGGTAVGQWRPTPPAFGPMVVQGLAFTAPFIVESATQFRPAPPRPLSSETYAEDLAAVAALGRRAGSTRTEDQTALATFWDTNASIHWNQAATQMARANHLSLLDSARLLAAMNVAMADTVTTIWASKRFYGADPRQVTWRPVTSIASAETDGNPATAAEPDWQPLIDTPLHPEYPAGHPSLNGAAATVLLDSFDGRSQTFTLTTTGQPSRTYTSIAQARSDGNQARVWGGMHYPSSVRISDAVGQAIARHVDRVAMQRAAGK